MEKKTVLVVLVISALLVVGAAAAALLWPADNEDKVIYWVKVAPVDQKAQLTAGNIDGGVSWEPYCSDSIVGGVADPLVWSGDFWPSHPCCVIAVNKEFADENQDIVARVVKSHIEATEWIMEAIADKDIDDTNYTKLLSMGAAFSNRNATVVEASLEHIVLDYSMPQDFSNYLVNFTNDFIELEQTSLANIQNRGYSSVSDFVDVFVDESYLALAQSVERVNETIGSVRLGYLNGDLHQFARVVAMNSTLWDGTAYEGKNMFEQFGVGMTTPEQFIYDNGAYEMTAFEGGNIDMGYLGSPPAIIKHLATTLENSDIRIVAQVNSEGSAIIVDPSITTIDQLQGKTLATPGPGSIQHLMLLAFGKEYGFEIKLAGT